MNTGASTLPSTWWRMMVSVPAPLARAASMKSSARTCVVAVSATRHIGGMNTSVRAIMPLSHAAAHGAGDRDRQQHGGERVEHVHRAHDGGVDRGRRRSRRPRPAVPPMQRGDQSPARCPSPARRGRHRAAGSACRGPVRRCPSRWPRQPSGFSRPMMLSLYGIERRDPAAPRPPPARSPARPRRRTASPLSWRSR